MPGLRSEPFSSFSFGFYLLAAMMLLTLPLKWCAAIPAAAAVHELFHLAALRLCGTKPDFIRIGFSGAVISAAPLSPGRMLFCALAGPAGGLLLMILMPVLPRLALCGAAQSLFNLLPLPNLDGGTALKCLCRMLFGFSAAEKICSAVGKGCMILLAVGCIYGAIVLNLGILPGACFVMLALKTKKAKYPCKWGQQRVQ